MVAINKELRLKPKRQKLLEISGHALRGGSAKVLKGWWTWSGSNRRPLPCHGSALPAAPQAHIAGTLLCLRGTSIILAEVDAIVNASGTQGNPIHRRQTNFLSARGFFRIFPQVSSAIIDCAPHLHNFSKTT